MYNFSPHVIFKNFIYYFLPIFFFKYHILGCINIKYQIKLYQNTI